MMLARCAVVWGRQHGAQASCMAIAAHCCAIIKATRLRGRASRAFISLVQHGNKCSYQGGLPGSAIKRQISLIRLLPYCLPMHQYPADHPLWLDVNFSPDWLYKSIQQEGAETSRPVNTGKHLQRLSGITTHA